ncbi:lamin tail domain-containing protein [bacterium]|nr:lamin tail domain-containing protein [bacterium]
MYKRFLTIVFMMLLASSLLFAASAGDVVINEISWMGTSASTSDEWIEFYNTTGSDIDIANWSIYGADTGVTLNFSVADGESTTVIPAGGYLVYANDVNVFTSGATEEIWDATIGLNVGGDEIILYDAQNGGGNVIDTADDNSGTWFAGVAAGFYTMERIDPCSDGTVSSNWATNDGVTKNGEPSINGTPGQANSCMNSTCGGGETVPPQVIDTTPNSGATSVSLGQDIIIVFDEAMNTSTAESAFSIVPDVTGKVFSWNAADSQMTVVHDTFAQGQLYTVTITSGAQDTSGNGLDGDADGGEGPSYVFTFTTVSTDGSGTCPVDPTSAENGVLTEFSFLFTAQADLSGGQVEITVPATWTTPSTNSNNDGYVTVTSGAGATCSLNGISGTGPWTLLVDCTNLEAAETFTLKYGDTSGSGSGATSSTDALYTFTTKSKGSGGTLTEIGTSPTVNVYTPGAGDGSGTAALNYQDNDPIFAGGIGSYVYINYTPGATYDIYKVSITVPSNWSPPTTDNVDVLLDGVTSLSEDIAYFTVSGQEITYDYYAYNSNSPLANPSYLQFRFKGMEASSSTSDNGFIIKSSASDPSTPGELDTTSPITVNMTNTKWYTVYFNDSVDQTYAATTQLQATTLGMSLGTSLDNQLENRIGSALDYVDGAFYTAGIQSLETELVDGSFANFRWWTEKYYWDSENDFHSDLESAYGGAAVRNDADDGSGDTGLSHNKFIVLDYDHATSPVKNLIMTGSWNINASGTTNDAQNVIYFQDYDVATLYTQEMNEFWAGRSGGGKTYSGIGTRYHEFTVGGGKKVQFGRSDNNVEIYMAPNDDIHQKMITAINNAHSSIYFCVFTFTNANIYSAIKNRWLSGVQVEGVFDSFQAGSSYSKYSDMVADGMDVKKDSVPGLLHHKYMIIDCDSVRSDPVVITGSTNWTNATDVTGDNDENTIIIHDANVANEFYQEFRARYGPSANITPADADIVPLTCSTNEVKTITLTVTHNGTSGDNMTKVSVWFPDTWSPAPSSANTIVKRNDGHYYNLVTDVTFTAETGGTWVKLICPSTEEIISGGTGGTESVDFVFTNFTSPSSAGPTAFTTKVDWDSNPNAPELSEVSPTPAINIRAGVVVINEVFFRGDNTEDWIEIYCASGGPINVQNWYLTRFSDSDTPNDKIKVLPDITLADGDLLLVTWETPLSSTDETDGTGKGDTKWDIYVNGAENGQMIATDEQVVLKDNLDRFVDAVGWAEHGDASFRTGETTDFTILIDNNQWEDYAVLGTVETTDFLNSDLLDPVAKELYSFARKSDGFDNNQIEDWLIEGSPTPGSGNANLPLLVINEVCYYGSTTSINYFRGIKLEWDWIEIYCLDDTNGGNGIDLDGYIIYEENGAEVTLPSVIIKTGQYLLIEGTTGSNDSEAQVVDNVARIYDNGLALSSGDSYLTLKDSGDHILDFVAWADWTSCPGNWSATTTFFDAAQENGEWYDYAPGSCIVGSVSADDRENDAVCINNDGTNGSIARDGDSTDTNDKVDWSVIANGSPTPGMPNTTPVPSGKMFVTPNKVRPSTSYDFTLEFVTATEPIEMYYTVVPAAFGDPNGWTINLLGTDGGLHTVGTYGAAAGGGTAIWVDGFTGDYLEPGATSALEFVSVTSPAALGGYIYYSGSKVVGEFPYEVANNPVVTVLDGIILISEVNFESSSTSSDYWGTHDWVELYIKDVGGAGIDISSFLITDMDGTDTSFAGSAVTVHTGDYVVVHWIVGEPDETDGTGDTNGNGFVDLYVDDTPLTDTDDQAALMNGAVYYDCAVWANDDGVGTDIPGDVPTLVVEGQWLIEGASPQESDCSNSSLYNYSDSLVRISLASDSDNLYDWARTTTLSPGAANVLDYDGTGIMQVSDTIAGFAYTLTSSHDILDSGTKWQFRFVPQCPVSDGVVSINILPVADGWTAPDTSFISISASEDAVIGSFSISGNHISIPIVSMSQNETMVLTYGTGNDITVGTKASGNDFPFGTKFSGSDIVYPYDDSPEVNLVALAGDHIEVEGPFSNGILVGDSATFTIRLVDEYGNQAPEGDPNATLDITLTIDDFVADNSEDIDTTTLTGATNVDGGNDVSVTGALVGSDGTVRLIDYEPTTGQVPRTLRVTVVDDPSILSGSAVHTIDVSIYPPLTVKKAYSVHTTASDKYKEINVEFTAPFDSYTLGDTTAYSLTKDSGAPHPGVDSFYALTDNRVLRVIPGLDLIPGETYTIAVSETILDGLGVGTTIVAPFTAKFMVPYESGINIAVNEVNNFDATTVTGGRYDLFPVWSPDGTEVAYVSDSNGVCNVYTLDVSNTSNSPVQLTTNLEDVLYFSQIAWGTDGYIYYATYNSAEDHSRLFRRLDDGTGSPVELTTDTWHGWYDPDYCPAAQQPDSTDRLVVTIGGDLYAIDLGALPIDADNQDLSVIKLTHLSDEYSATASRCLQPKWWWGPAAGYPDADELKVAFVYESRTDDSTQIYILNDVEEIINTAIGEATGSPSNMVTVLGDARMTLVTHAPGNASAAYNTLPKWSPSWSLGNNENGGIISYVQDENDLFDNAIFNDVSSGTAVTDSLTGVNFNTYMTNWDDPVLATDDADVNFIPQIIGNNSFNEAFMSWAPAGGDKITYITKVGDTYTLSILPIETQVEVGPSGGILFDNSFTQVHVPADALQDNTSLSVSPPDFVPAVTDDKMVETGEVREFYADDAGITFDEPVTMVIAYADADQDGYVDGSTVYEGNLKVWYYNSTLSPAQWELIGGEVDVDANTLTIQTNHFSTYGLYGYVESKAFVFEDVRIYPNPAVTTEQIFFDHIPALFDTMAIYNVAGEKVREFETADVDISDPGNPTIDWDTTNDDDNRLASGVYILVIETEAGSDYYKFAIIR